MRCRRKKLKKFCFSLQSVFTYKLLWTVHAVSHQRQLLQQHVHHGSILVLLEGLGLLRHLLCLGATLGLHRKRLGLTFNLKET